MDDSQIVDEDETIQKLTRHEERTKSPKFQVALVGLEIDKRGYIVKEGGKVRIERAVCPEAVKEVLKGEVTELHLDTEASLDGRVARRFTSCFNIFFIPLYMPIQRIWGVWFQKGRIGQP